MAYPYTGTASNASTQTGLSTQILVQVEGQKVGGIQSLSVDQRRPLKEITEVGTDGVIEITPSGATTFGIQIERIYFDRKTITEALGRAFLNIQSQRAPFDIIVYDYHNVPAAAVDVANGYDVSDASPGVIITVYENVWIESLSKSYSSGDYIIMENISCKCEFVHSHTGLVSAEQDGGGGAPTSAALYTASDVGSDDIAQLRKLERLVDVSRPGSLDARGLRTFGNLAQFR